MALSAGRSLLRFGAVMTLRERTERLMSVTPEQVAEAASQICSKNLRELTFC